MRWFHTKAILWIPALLSNQNKYFSKTTHWSSECTNHSRPCYSRQRWYRSKVRVLKTNSFLCFHGFAGWDSVVWKFSNLCHIWDFSPLLPVTGTKQTYKDFTNTSMIGILFRYYRRTKQNTTHFETASHRAWFSVALTCNVTFYRTFPTVALSSNVFHYWSIFLQSKMLQTFQAYPTRALESFKMLPSLPYRLRLRCWINFAFTKNKNA